MSCTISIGIILLLSIGGGSVLGAPANSCEENYCQGFDRVRQTHGWQCTSYPPAIEGQRLRCAREKTDATDYFWCCQADGTPPYDGSCNAPGLYWERVSSGDNYDYVCRDDG